MTFLDFDNLSVELLKKVSEMKDTKGKEYAGTKDRFDNFNRLAERMKLDRKVIWNVYFAKHIDAIESYIREERTFSTESIEGRIVDAITYLTLLHGMIVEYNKDVKETQPLFQGVIDTLPKLYTHIAGSVTESGHQFCDICGAKLFHSSDSKSPVGKVVRTRSMCIVDKTAAGLG